MTLSGLIASGTSIAGYAELLLGGHTIYKASLITLSGLIPVSPGDATILHGITNNSLRVDTSITGYC